MTSFTFLSFFALAICLKIERSNVKMGVVTAYYNKQSPNTSSTTVLVRTNHYDE